MFQANNKVSIKEYVRNELPRQSFAKLGRWDRFRCNVAVLNRNHPILTKIVSFVILCIGIALIALMTKPSPLFLWSWGIPVFGALGCLNILIGLIALTVFSLTGLVVGAHHSATDHIYQEQEINKNGMDGSLKYDNDIPVLTINKAQNRFNAGKTYGYLIGKELSAHVNQFRFLVYKAGRLLRLSLPKPQHMQKTIDALKEHMPKEYLNEIEGFVDGYNLWCTEHGKQGKKTTIDELLILQLIPDCSHCRFAQTEEQIQNKKNNVNEELDNNNDYLGCTMIAANDEDEGIVFGRNLDWNVFKICGSSHIVIKWVFENKTTVAVTPPGILGPLTGMNSSGLSLAMNITRPLKATKQVNGIPALFYNRYILENFDSVEDAQEFIDKGRLNTNKVKKKSSQNKQEDCEVLVLDKIENEIEITQMNPPLQPLGPYHLMLADESQASIFHLYQGEGQKHYIRPFKSDEGPLYTTNPYYDSEERSQRREPFFWSKERERRIKKFFNHAQERIENPKIPKLIKVALSLPFVNNFITSQSIMLYPKSRRLEIAADNSYAASEKRRSIKPFEN